MAADRSDSPSHSMSATDVVAFGKIAARNGLIGTTPARGSGVFVAACPKAAGMGDVHVHQARYRISVASFECGQDLVVLVSGGD